MDSIKSNFYSCFSLKNSEHNRIASTKNIFEGSGNVKSPQTNSYAEKILSLVNAAHDEKFDYDYLLGWESAKIMAPKLCNDIKYKTRILIVHQTPLFIKGFYAYVKQNFAKYDVDKSFAADIRHYKEIQKLFLNESINLLAPSETPKSKTFDGIISCDYGWIPALHPKGILLNLIPRVNPEIGIMFCAFLFRNVMLVDNPILSELMTICHSIQNSSRQGSRICDMFPDELSQSHPETFEAIAKDMDLKNIIKYIQDRQSQLDIFDYCSIWSSHNESFFKTKSLTNLNDILDFSKIEEFPQQQQNEDENKKPDA